MSKAADYPSSLVSFEGAVGLQFVAKNPLARDNVSPRWFVDEAPCPIALKGLEFIFHGGMPIGVL